MKNVEDIEDMNPVEVMAECIKHWEWMDKAPKLNIKKYYPPSRDWESACILCEFVRIHHDNGCVLCPMYKKWGGLNGRCTSNGSTFENWRRTDDGSPEELIAIKEVLRVLKKRYKELGGVI